MPQTSLITFSPLANTIKSFHFDNLLPFHGNTVILCHKVTLPRELPWNGSKLQWYCFLTLAPDKAIPNTLVIYRHILTLVKEGTTVNYHSIFIT